MNEKLRPSNSEISLLEDLLREINESMQIAETASNDIPDGPEKDEILMILQDLEARRQSIVVKINKLQTMEEQLHNSLDFRPTSSA